MAWERVRSVNHPGQYVRAIDVGQLGRNRFGRQEIALDELAQGFPSRSFFSGMMAVWGMGNPSGRRNSAVTANQSASPPTNAASQKARR